MFRQLPWCILIASTVIALTATSARAQPAPLDGRWLAGELGEEFEMLVEITGDRAVVTPFRHPDQSDTLTIDATQAPLYVLSSTSDESLRVILLLETPNQARVWANGDAGLARRIGDFPSALLGTWHFMESPEDVYDVTFAPTEATFTMEGETERSPVYGLVADGPLVEVAIAEPGDNEPYQMHLIAMPENSYFLYLSFEEEGFVLYQGDAAPGWTELFADRGSNVCMAAYEYFRGCLEEVCAGSPTYPACGMLDEPPPVDEPCPPEMQEMADQVMNMACEDLFPDTSGMGAPAPQ